MHADCLHVNLMRLMTIGLMHCSIHVASVVQMTHMLLHHGGVAKVMTDPQIFAAYYAALTHDFEHLGVNNDYLIKSWHPLAVMYNDLSPLENHHLAAAVRVMQRPECRYVVVSIIHSSIHSSIYSFIQSFTHSSHTFASSRVRTV